MAGTPLLSRMPRLLDAVQLSRPMDRITALLPVVFLSLLAIGLTAAWTESRTELAYLRAAEPVPAVLGASGAWLAEAGEVAPGRARAFAHAEVDSPRQRRRWMGLVGMASLMSLGLAASRTAGSSLPITTGRPVPLVPTLA